ncbi:gephyrin-like molybdotransferase Glp [Pseudactinotalea sp. Z1739]|uniref:molybdopterin molybdotransferase MoeA n=1 Tax=Pseudactinotalea sp. Z1739 TaxID=3413028 RepID=UPI003C7B9305
MKSVSAHLRAILDLLQPLPALAVVLHDAVGCVLAEDILAPADLPPRDVATQDGYAVRSVDVAGANPDRAVSLRVLDEVRAGARDTERLVALSSVRIASGAPIPAGADAVVPLERTDRGMATVEVRTEVGPGTNVRAQGADLRADQVAMAAGERVGARQVALLAALGRSRVSVHPRPRVVLVSVGDELVEPGRRISTGEVYDANGHALATAVQDAGGSTFRVAAVPDERTSLREVLEDQLVRADLIITTGGLSAGANDTVKEVLSPLGTVRFDNVAIAPGRQFGVGEVGEGTPIVCLPGNPVAAQIGYEVFVRPALLSMAGHADLYRPTVTAAVTQGWSSPLERREFVPVHLTGTPDEGYRAAPTGDPLLLTSMSRANALVVVPQDVGHVATGDRLAAMVLES